MKMMRKNWKDRKGVSPVIATILMVAITVVLAAVLYVMVMGFGGDSDATPKVALSKVDNGDGTYTISVVSVSGGSIKFGEVQAVVSPSDVATSGGLKQAGATGDADGDKVLSAGDYVVLTAAKDGKVTLTLQDIESGDGLGSITLDVKTKS